MHINVRPQSKSRLLLELIHKYNKSPEDTMLVEQSKQASVNQIERQYKQSQINRNYVYPRQPEAILKTEPPKTTSANPNFKDLLHKIYLTNMKKSTSQIKQEMPKKQAYSIQKQLQLSHSQNRIITDHSQHKLITDISKQSRGTSPDNKVGMSSRSISTQLLKYLKQGKKVIQRPQVTYQTCKSFELREKFNRSPLLLDNRSFDFSKIISKLK